MHRLPAVLFVAFLYPISNTSATPFDSTDRYETREIQGWTIRINKTFLQNQPELSKNTIALLDHQLFQVVHKLPFRSVGKLRKVVIWVEESESHHPCMAYHPDAKWLREHDMNPAKARCVEIAGARNFLTWTKEQPWMVLHELAHAYHHQFLKQGFENAEVSAAFDRSRKSKGYEAVLHYDGKTVPAYAATNPMEYFAESTEAFFGANDFYPFVRAELKNHDSDMHRLLISLWGAK